MGAWECLKNSLCMKEVEKDLPEGEQILQGLLWYRTCAAVRHGCMSVPQIFCKICLWEIRPGC